MSIPNVMFEAVKSFEPLEIYANPAIRKAVEAGEAYCVEHSQTVNRASLTEAASEIWTQYIRVMHSKLLPKEVRENLPPLYSQENERDPMVRVKFFTPNAGWTWLATEFDGLDVFFGYVIGQDSEFGYFSLSELEGYIDPLGLGIERDLYFHPKRLSQIKEDLERYGGMVVGLVLVIEINYDPQTELNPDPTEENPYPIAVYFTTGHYFLKQWSGHDWIVATNNSELEEEVKEYVTARFEPGDNGSWYPIAKEIAAKARFPEKGDLYDAQQNRIDEAQTL